MSDTTSLSSNYSASAAFATHFNQAVLVLKRWHLVANAVPRPAVGEEAAARQTLAEHVRGLIAELAPGGAPRVLAERTPDGVISRLAEKHRDKLSWFLSDLRQIEQCLTGTGALDEHAFEALDEVCDAADATASASFRRLWRR
jgi:hypothetical protein